MYINTQGKMRGSLLTAILISFLLLSSFDLSQAVDESLWAKYQMAFGDSKMADSFSATDSLRQCHTATSAGALDTTTNPPPQVGCSTYENGDKISVMLRGLKSRDGAIMRPYYVSEINDRMCFVVARQNPLPADIVNLFDFLYPMPSALKVHSSIFEAVTPKTASDKTIIDSITSSDILLLSALMNATDSENDKQLEIVDEIYQAASQLSLYKFGAYDNFFWTSPSQEPFFDGSGTIPLNVQTSIDKKRYDTWRSLSLNMVNTFARRLTTSHFRASNNDPTDNDPCLFKSTTFESRIDGIAIPLGFIKSLEEPLRSSCLTYLTAYFAEQAKVFNLALVKRPHLMNFRARSIMQSKLVGSQSSMMSYTLSGLRGDGQIVSVADTGLDVNSCFFRDSNGRVSPSNLQKPNTDKSKRKVIQYSYNGENGAGDTNDLEGGHGTHVSGTIVGNIEGADISSGNAIYNGVAPNAKLVFIDLSTDYYSVSPPSVNALYYAGYSAGARVHTNSWGGGYQDYYGSTAIDNYLFNHMDFTILFSAGNEGDSGDRTCGPEAQSKNVVAVGSSETTFDPNQDIGNIAYYSSRGPAYDGRIKPDIVATGDSLVSAKASGGNSETCETIDMSGTSMSSPAAAGVALLIRQFFVDPSKKFWTRTCKFPYKFCKSFTPSGVLVKAALLHSGSKAQKFHGGGDNDVDLPNVPDNFQGYGIIFLQQVLPLLSFYPFDLYVDDLRQINPNSAIDYVVNVIDTSRPLKVTVSWYDPPGIDGASTPALLHNLNLLVTSPSGQKYYGNNRNGFDTLNNNEQITVDNPTIGTWKVSVLSKSLPVTGSQKYSLVITSRGMVMNEN